MDMSPHQIAAFNNPDGTDVAADQNALLGILSGAESNSYEQELIRRSVDQFFGEFAMVTEDQPRSANVTALTHVKLVTINKKDYGILNADHNNVFEAIFAPHKRDGDQSTHHVPSSRPKSRILKRLKGKMGGQEYRD